MLFRSDQLGYPVSILMTNCLWVPGAHRRLVSAVALATDGYQTVLPSKDPHFAPGLYVPRDATGVQRYIPFVMQNGLCFIPTTSEGPASNISAGPQTRQSKVATVEQLSRRLGFMPMNILRESVCSGCLEGHGISADAKFPSLVSSAARIGKARHIPRPPVTPQKWTRPLACI